MYCRFSIEQVLSPDMLTKIVSRFEKEELPRFQKNEDYYKVETVIRKRTMTSGKPNNKLAHGFARYITNMATSYFMGKPIKYQAEDAAYMDVLNEVFTKNYLNTVNYEASKEGSINGIAFILLYLNEQGTIKIKECAAGEIIPIYSPSLSEFLEAGIRIYKEIDIDGKLIAKYADVYSQKKIYRFKKNAGEEKYSQIEDYSHGLSDIPIIVIWNNKEQMGDFEPHISLIDAYDRSQSDTANDMEYFTDAYLCISGAGELEEELMGDREDSGSKAAKTLREDRLLLLDETGQAQWLVKNINDTAVENFKNRLYSDLFFLAQVPALTDESFAGNITGIAIKYKLIGIEELTIMKQNRFEAAQKKLIQIVTDHINLKYNKSYDSNTVSQKYERNFIDNVSDIIEDVAKLEGIVSKETQLNMLPKSIVESAADEMDRMLEEQAQSDRVPMVNTGMI